MRRLGAVLACLVLAAGAAGCGSARAAPAPPRVVTRVLDLARGPGRPLPTTVWYPADLGSPAVRHPVLLFSHGLGGLPEHFAPLLSSWAEAGYLVAAPAYPHTNARVHVDRDDIGRQSADAAYVLAAVQALDRAQGDPFAGHVDTGRAAAVGFSAGGTTTLGLLRRGHDPSLRAAVSIAGRRPGWAFGGPAVPALFVHGDRDTVVPIGAGRQAYAALPWPKRFLAVPGEGHGPFLNPGDPAYRRTSAEILSFLTATVPPS